MTVKELKEFLKDLPDDAKVILLKTTPEEPRVTYKKYKYFDKTVEKVVID